MDRLDGLTDAEGHVLKALSEAAEQFKQLPVQHGADLGMFVAHIHELQLLLAVRIVRREHPEGWPCPR